MKKIIIAAAVVLTTAPALAKDYMTKLQQETWIRAERLADVKGTSGKSCAQTCLSAQTADVCEARVEADGCFEARDTKEGRAADAADDTPQWMKDRYGPDHGRVYEGGRRW